MDAIVMQEDSLPMDIVGGLPVELGEKILGFLEPKQLALSGRVCRKWHLLADSDILWARFVPRSETTVALKDDPPSTACKNKTFYIRHVSSLEKFKKFHFWTQSLPPSFTVTALANGGVLAFVLPRKIQVFDLNGGTLTLHQEVEVTLPRVYMSNLVSTSEDGGTLAVSANCGEICLVFSWSGSRLRFDDCVYAKRSASSSIVDFYSAKANPLCRTDVTAFTPLFVNSDYVLLLDLYGCVHFWSISRSRCAAVAIFGRDSRHAYHMKVFERGGVFYFRHGRKLHVYDPEAVLTAFTLEMSGAEYLENFETTFYLHFNGLAVLAVLTGPSDVESRAWAWDTHHKKICEAFNFNVNCVLHPWLPAACLFRKAGDAALHLIAEDLKTKLVHWSLELSLLPIMNIIEISNVIVGILYEEREGCQCQWQIVHLDSGEKSDPKPVSVPLDSLKSRPNYFVTRKLIYSPNPLIPKTILAFT